MAILIYAEHDNSQLKSESLKLVNAATKMGDDLHLLVVGHQCADVAAQASEVDGVRDRKSVV